jgi:hypothetical protein
VEVVRGFVARVVIVEVTSAKVIVTLMSVVTGSETVEFNISVDDMYKVFMEVDISEVLQTKSITLSFYYIYN